MMDKYKALQILEALADGCSPETGEILGKDNLINNSRVNSALNIAITELKRSAVKADEVNIEDQDIKDAISLFKEYFLKPSPNRLIGFFLGTRKFRNQKILLHPIYGKYRNQYQKGQLLDFFENYFEREKSAAQPWQEIAYFQEQTFNKLSDKAINQLKKKIRALGIMKTDNLTENILQARKRYRRSHEPWTTEELDLLTKALKYTNDLSLLSECFGRSRTAVEICGQKILYKQNNKNNRSKTEKSDPHD
ncbi:MAG: hypothetical protein P8X42_12135 [Calditrichaceae bacterium]